MKGNTASEVKRIEAEKKLGGLCIYMEAARLLSVAKNINPPIIMIMSGDIISVRSEVAMKLP